MVNAAISILPDAVRDHVRCEVRRRSAAVPLKDSSPKNGFLRRTKAVLRSSPAVESTENLWQRQCLTSIKI